MENAATTQPVPTGRGPPSLTHVALGALARCAGAVADGSEEAAFLADVAQPLPASPDELARIAREALAAPVPADAPLARLAASRHLSLVEVLSISLAAAVESDLMVGRVVAHLQAPVGGSRPTLGLLAVAFGSLDEPSVLTPPRLIQRPAFRQGILVLAAGHGPLPETAVSIALPLCLALADEDLPWPGSTWAETPAVPIPESIRAQCRRHAAALDHPGSPALILRSSGLEEPRAAADEIARALGRRSCFLEQVTGDGLGAWLELRGLVPVFIVEAAPGEIRTVPAIPGYRGPVLVAASLDGSIEISGRDALTWDLPVPTPEERQALWRQTSATLASEELARDHRVRPARIARLARLAAHRATVRGAAAVDAADVRAVTRSGEGADLDTLAQRMPEPVPDEALIRGTELRQELEALLARCRQRDGLAAGLGRAALTRYTPGVRALFVGASGTGKTLAAGWLATKLGLPLYLVDLSAVSSKYIGETEKNLSRLLARAERSESVLLFDEADALFGQRTDVRESNDRYANAQTNYLLQRIETFDGIALLTSNSRSRFDPAFARRLDMVVEFPAPSPVERRALWEAHLGPHHTLTVSELNLLAGQCDFAGGQIRNVVLGAAAAARAAGQPLDFAAIGSALRAEYRKAGRVPPAGLGLR